MKPKNYYYSTTGTFPNYIMKDFSTTFDSFFNDVEKVLSTPSKESPLVYSDGYPKVTIKNYEDRFSIEADVPGLTKKEITLSVRDGNLIINGNKRTRNDEKCDVIYNEVKSSSFSRTVALPIKSVDIKGITSSLDNGILTIDIPKKEKEDLFLDIDIK